MFPASVWIFVVIYFVYALLIYFFPTLPVAIVFATTVASLTVILVALLWATVQLAKIAPNIMAPLFKASQFDIDFDDEKN